MQKKIIFLLMFSVLGLLALGIVMLFSTSAYAGDAHGDPFHFLKRQSMWLGISAVVCVAAAMTDYHIYKKLWPLLFGGALVLLLLCFVPHIGMNINGSRRWLHLGPLAFQPSEIGKLAAIVFLAVWFEKFESRSKEFFRGFVFPLMVIGVLILPIAGEVDLGTTALIAGTTFAVMFIAGTRLPYLVSLVVIGVGGILFVAMHIKERLARMVAFLDLEKFKESVGLQQWQALISFGSGGVDGLGLGNGREKMLYLPFAHTDFIFPMIGEELGLRVTLLVVLGYSLIIICGMAIAMRARDRFGMLLGAGVVTMISLQAAVNIAVTTALMPNKGLPLPFISYGGSNLMFCLLGIGILINIYRHGGKEPKPLINPKAKPLPRI